MKVSGKTPVLGERVFVAPNANVMGEVKLGSGSSVWYGAVLRGETYVLQTRSARRGALQQQRRKAEGL